MPASRRPLLIGEAPPSPGMPPFAGRSGAYLARLLGMPHGAFLLRFEPVNLLGAHPGRRAKGRLVGEAGMAAAAGRLDLSGRVAVLCGRRVAAAFGLRGVGWFEPLALGRGEAAAWAVPHPSGIVQWWNDAANRNAARRLLCLALRSAAGET